MAKTIKLYSEVRDSVDGQPWLTIDGTNINGITQDYTALVDIVVVTVGLGAYDSTDVLKAVIDRTTGNLTVTSGTVTHLGDTALSSVALVASGTNAVLNGTASPGFKVWAYATVYVLSW